MCRSNPEGGRRCPSCQDKEKRSAYNRAAYLIRKLAAEKERNPITATTEKSTMFPKDFDDSYFGSSKPIPVTVKDDTSNLMDDAALRAETDALLRALRGSPKLAASEPKEQLSELERLANMVKVDDIASHAQELFAGSEAGWGSASINYSDLTDTTAYITSANQSEEMREKTIALSDRIYDAFKKDIVFGTPDSERVMTCQVVTVQWEDYVVVVRGEVKDSDGTYVAGWVREIYYEGAKHNPSPFMEYGLLRVADGYRGQSLGTKLISHFDSVTLATGLDTVELGANIDIGGYAWAKQGYDWNVTHDEHRENMNDLETRMYREINNNPEDAQEISALLKRLQEPYGPNYPLPVDIANLGKGNKDAEGLWAGKRILLNSTWQAIRKLV
jgi:GNAT superfamily N-acetyltransferase